MFSKNKIEINKFLNKSFIISLLLFFIYICIYKIRTGDINSIIGYIYNYFINSKLLFFLAVFLLLSGIIIHELVHGFFFAKNNSKSCKSVKFGFSRVNLAPYTHCNEPIKVKHYRVAIVMPTVLLGNLPLVGYLVFDITWFWLYSLFFTISGVGDLLLFWQIRRIPPEEMIKDHPTKIGYILNNE